MTDPETKSPGGTSQAATQSAAIGRAPTVTSFGQFIQMLEDGTLHGDLTQALEDIAASLNDRAMMEGPKRKQKGKLSLTIDFSLEGGIFEIDAKHTVKLPQEPRGKSIMWSNSSNQFTPQNPRQINMFDGPRELT